MEIRISERGISPAPNCLQTVFCSAATLEPISSGFTLYLYRVTIEFTINMLINDIFYCNIYTSIYILLYDI